MRSVVTGVVAIGALIDTFEDCRPGEFPQYEEQDDKRDEHPDSQAEINFKKIHVSV